MSQNGHFLKSVSWLWPLYPQYPLNSSEEDPTSSPLSIYSISTNPFGFFLRGILIKVPQCLIHALKSLILGLREGFRVRSLYGVWPGGLFRYRRLILLGSCLKGAHSRWASIYPQIPPQPLCWLRAGGRYLWYGDHLVLQQWRSRLQNLFRDIIHGCRDIWSCWVQDEQGSRPSVLF